MLFRSMTGSDVEDAQAASYNDPVTGLREYIVSLVLTESGKQAFAEATAAAVENQDYIMIIYDNMIISAPTVQSAITDGRCQITGMPDFDTAANLASTIRIGSLPLELRELRSNVVGAKLGEEAISTSLLAGLIGFILVVVFMVAAYRIDRKSVV